MPRSSTGTHYERNGQHFARVTIEGDKRRSFAIAGCRSAEEAATRAAALAKVAVALRRAGMAERTEGVLAQAAPSPAATVEALAKKIAAGAYSAPTPSTAPTIAALAKRWTTGELAREFPDHVRWKRSADDDEHRFRNHILPIVGDMAVDAFTLDDADRVMRSLPVERSIATRRHVAQLLTRLFSIAVFPLRMIKASPIPRGFLPKPAPPSTQAYVYPSEDRRLLASPAVPLHRRILWGFLHREGVRSGEAKAFTFSDLDLEVGAVNLDKNKTNDPRSWALSPGTAAALRAWRELRKREAGSRAGAADAPVFVNDRGKPIRSRHLALLYRKDLRAAGIDRAELFAVSKARRHVWAHATRAAFVTTALANGKTEAFVMDRTGHRSSQMVNAYRRAARRSDELNLGNWTPLATAIPELAGEAAKGSGTGSGTTGGSANGGARGDRSRSPSKQALVHEEGLEPSSLAAPEPKGSQTTTTAPDREDSRGFADRPEASSGVLDDPRAASGGAPAASRSPLGHLAAAIGAAVAADDLDTARELTSTLARLLAAAEPKPAEPSGKVLDLDARRRRTG